MPQMSPSQPYLLEPQPAGPARTDLPPGLSVDLYGFPVGCVALGASSRHLVSMHVGEPIKASCRCDGRTYNRVQTEGDIDFVPAGIPGYWEDESPAQALVVRLPPDLVRRVARGMGVPVRAIRFEPRFQMRDRQVEFICQAMRAEIEAGRPGGRVQMESLCTALAGRLVQAFATSDPATARSTQMTGRQRRQIESYIDERLDENLTVTRLAAVAGMSESHFKAMFRSTFGRPVHQFVMERRVERACGLLADGALPIAQVALEAGFSHQSHLARWMRRIVGTTPAAYVRKGAA